MSGDQLFDDAPEVAVSDCLLCDHPRSSHAPRCRVRMGVDRDDMNTYTICLCPGFEGAEEENDHLA